MKARSVAVAALFLATWIGDASGRNTILNVDERSRGYEMEVVSAYTSLPPAGHAPVVVTVKNRTTGPLVWNLVFSANYNRTGITMPIRIEAPPGKESRINLSIPITPVGSGRSMPSLHVTADGPGAGGMTGYTSGSWFGDTGTNNGTDFFLMTSEVARNTWPELDKKFKALKIRGYGSQLDPSDFSTDWRDYAGVSAIFVAPREYAALDGTQKAAVETWVNQGGSLVLSGETITPGEITQLIPSAKSEDGQARLGAGKIVAIASPEGRMDPAVVRGFITDRKESLPAALDVAPSSNAFLKEGIKPPGLNEGLLMTIAFAFAVAVAPLNLILLARRRQRHLLFLTVPAMSLLASFALGVAIFVGDGVGGSGNRSIVVQYHDGQPVKTVVQEELSVTGLLFGSDFSLPTTAMAMLPPNQSHRQDNLALNVQPNGRHTGEWYASRSERGMLSSDIRSTREKISLVADNDGWKVLSQCESAFDTLILRDPEGGWRIARNVTTGSPATLEVLSDKERADWMAELEQAAGPRGRMVIEAMKRRRDSFFAVGPGAESDRLPTLGSIRFRTRTAFTGTVQP